MTKYLCDIVDLISLADGSRTLRDLCSATCVPRDSITLDRWKLIMILLDHLTPKDVEEVVELLTMEATEFSGGGNK